MTQPPTLGPRPVPLYPTLNSLQAVIDLADTRRPLMGRNEVKAMLMTYHNTLLHQIEQGRRLWSTPNNRT